MSMLATRLIPIRYIVMKVIHFNFSFCFSACHSLRDVMPLFHKSALCGVCVCARIRESMHARCVHTCVSVCVLCKFVVLVLLYNSVRGMIHS